MRNKLTCVFSQIHEYQEEQREHLSPEYIALEFMKWKKRKTGENVSYFRNTKRNGSKAWKYFEELSELLRNWKSKDIDIPLNRYFDRHSKFLGANKNLYPHQLVSPKSYKYIFGNNCVDPTYINYFSGPSPYERYQESIEFYSRIYECTEQELILDPVLSSVLPEWVIGEYKERNNLI